jgi:uncharacterized membrane protein
MATTSSRLTNFPTTHQGIRDLDQPQQTSRNDPMRVNVGDGERSASALGGAALLAAGLAHGGCAGLAMIWGGAALLLRGVTGHCAVNEALRRSTA